MKQKPPIAVVGMAGIFPGAPDLDTFWHNIVNKIDASGEVPPDRWIVAPDAIYDPDPRPDKTFSKRACLIHDFEFNPEGIDLDKELLNALDPLHQLVLHAGRQALAGCATDTLNKKNIGTILAAIALPTDASSKITRKILGTSFEERLFGQPRSDLHVPLSRQECLAARVTSLPAALLSESLGLGGGSYTLDAACASSLYAVKLACDELSSFRADAMLAGGVSRPENLYTQIGFSQLRALSPSGRCAPFNERADGLVVGEGVGILVLKRLNDARRDQDRIFALIQGAGLSNDMRGKLLAPDSEGQVRAMRSAYAAAGWSPQDVDLIECHATGTPVGDAIELQSLRSLWGKTGWSTGQCPIGSIKSNIGHLLTAAGAAGMIKTLLAIQHQTFPPSLNFHKAPKDSPLINSPFRVQIHAESWARRDAQTPRRAAVSAFGFGGINSHLLFEEWNPDIDTCGLKIEHSRAQISTQQSSSTPGNPGPTLRSDNRQSSIAPPSGPDTAVAIVGLAASFGRLKSLKAFQEAVFKGESVIAKRPATRWKGADTVAGRHLEGRAAWGGFLDNFTLSVGDLHIPPNEIPDILIQHLLMLKVAVSAMQDARLPLRAERPRMGAVIGIDFDFEATDFHLRWNLFNRVFKWKTQNLPGLDSKEETARWLESLRDASGPPLTATRTLGALGGIIASRIAREFRFGGPCFVVSGEETSGLRALEIGLRSIQQHETDAFLVGAVDLCGDVRRIITANQVRPFTKNHFIRPFDISADGTLPGEGAAALVLKPLEQAIKNGDRIYAVIKGIGSASGGGTRADAPSKDAYMLSLKRCFQDAGVSASSISLIQTHGSGHPGEDRVELEALGAFFGSRSGLNTACAIGSVKPNIGHTGAAAGLASLAATGLCLYQEIIPPLANFIQPQNDSVQMPSFHMPAFGQYWLRDRKDGPRRACAGAMTADGNCMHVILEGFEYEAVGHVPEIVHLERQRPLETGSPGLFVVEGNDRSDLIAGLEALNRHLDGFSQDEAIEAAALSWHLKNRLNPDKMYAVSLVAGSFSQIAAAISDARSAVSSAVAKAINGPGGFSYSTQPLGPKGQIAFVFPGSGNHYVGMGRGIGVRWPEILRKMDAETAQLKTQMIPECYVPWSSSWHPGWEHRAHQKLISDPLNMIFGQVVHGCVVANLVGSFGITPAAVIGYSLGESAGLFALGAWPDRGEMLKRMSAIDLFSRQLAGPCLAARKAWNLPPDQDFNWCAAVVNRPAAVVRSIIEKWPFARLLIVNTPDQCVIGGRKGHIEAAVRELGCEAVFLEGVVTVHCNAVTPVAQAYKQLHLFPVTPPEGIRFYSCALGRSYELNSDSAAEAILRQAADGFDFTALIAQAYQDGLRIFLEMGPHASCTGMIKNILGKKPHLAISADVRGEDDFFTMLKFLGTLIAERVPVDLDPLYPSRSPAHQTVEISEKKTGHRITLIAGGKAPSPTLPQPEVKTQRSEVRNRHTEITKQEVPASAAYPQLMDTEQPASKASWSKAEIPLKAGHPVSSIQYPAANIPYAELIQPLADITVTTSKAHQAFLQFSDDLSKGYAKTFDFQTQLLETVISNQDAVLLSELAQDDAPATPLPSLKDSGREAVFDRDMCLEFAVGSAAKVLGPEFAVIDTYDVRVRLPDEPLMLVDRILAVQGQKGSLGSGRVVTEHDVLPGAWYLDGGRAPVCISVEAGQADLFLCSYLGIDLRVKGRRKYRLLDAVVRFYRGLPHPGDVIRYEIDIDHFVRQGDTYLFFFRFEGFIGDERLISMFNGCAGFFTDEEVRHSGGIILTEDDTRPMSGNKAPDWKDLVPLYTESYNDEAVAALRKGNLAGCFGPLFDGINLAESLRLPGGRMQLIDRILLLDPAGGRFGLGLIRAEADIHPDDWFLTCHFMDDMVMPGTLMYECCAHTLRVFIQRLGWVSEKPGVCYEPVVGVESVLKCRGPVTPQTRQVWYEIQIKELGYAPEPYVIADALMYADGHRIVSFKDMSMKMTGITRAEIEAVWEQRHKSQSSKLKAQGLDISAAKKAIYDRDKILAFAVGKPSEAFGEPYRVFDQNRVIARLPGPPYSFLDRVVSIQPQAWVLKPDGWIEAEYDVPPEAWYFRADRSGAMPFCVLLEIALQPCGWLAAYMGSALRSEKDLKFRNLGGQAVLHRVVFPENKTLTVRTRNTKVSEAGEMIIEHFDFEVLQGADMVYDGQAYFGFFSKEALAQQVGIRSADTLVYYPATDELQSTRTHSFENQAPLTPDDPQTDPAPSLAMPADALRMIDKIKIYAPAGGPAKLGFICGSKQVNPDEWFFKAHFYQDPVCPGSLGIESFIQLLKFMALDRWKGLRDSHRFELVTAAPHHWTYRGQVIPQNKTIEVEALVTKIIDGPSPSMFANGFLKVDGLYIYQMENFGIRLVSLS
uniref:Type I polyketide synthase n=1 Tax=Candidatus Desulfatibia profunda TaxID=2841695 RepID=A0A8J6NKK7_9BACT|nr:type I polyketide synthase [Candidatus Desulfatibia profunda]